MTEELKFAVLIDADNISDKYIKTIFDEISNDGIATYKRIYGDWTSPTLSSWKKVLLDNSITPIHQYSYTTGKNATDSSMIIDAMDILYSDKVDGFCLVSSDSDFTRLAARLRESGMLVIGMGEKKTPSAFIAACSRFKYLDILSTPQNVPKSNSNTKEKSSAKTAAPPVQDSDVASEMTPITAIKKTVANFVTEKSDDDGWSFVGDIGNMLSKRYPDFDVRNFGFSKLTQFLLSFDIFDVRTEYQGPNRSLKLIYVRIKE